MYMQTQNDNTMHVGYTSLMLLHVSGAALHILGCALWTLVQGGHFVGNINDRTYALFNEILGEYDRQGVNRKERITGLTWSQICSSEAARPAAFPCLSSIKAAECKHLVGPVRGVCEKFHDGSAQSTHRLEVLRNLEMFFTIADSQPRRMSEDSYKDMCNAVQQALLHYSWLATTSFGVAFRLWLVTPKFHYWFHLAAFGRYENPRYTTTYADEDYMGRISKLVASCVVGAGPVRMASAIAFKTRRVLEIRWHRRAAMGHD